MFTHCLVDVHPSVGYTQINSGGGGVVKVVLILKCWYGRAKMWQGYTSCIRLITLKWNS
jgi:hypothetical protein